MGYQILMLPDLLREETWSVGLPLMVDISTDFVFGPAALVGVLTRGTAGREGMPSVPMLGVGGATADLVRILHAGKVRASLR
jgi:hypothetical protein